MLTRSDFYGALYVLIFVGICFFFASQDEFDFFTVGLSAFLAAILVGAAFGASIVFSTYILT